MKTISISKFGVQGQAGPHSMSIAINKRHCKICNTPFEPMRMTDRLCPWCKSGNEMNSFLYYLSRENPTEVISAKSGLMVA